MKIAVYAIAKNEEKFVKRFCESAKDADVILIADTGSEDKTVEEAKKYGAVVHNIFISPWRFDSARNAALALLPADVDVCISMDLDEILKPGWRKSIERLWVGDVNRIQHQFDNGGGLVFGVSRVHARKGFSWHYPCHEYVLVDPRNTEVLAATNDIYMEHHPDPTKSRGQYMPMLEMAVKENPNCHRSQFYYARELSYHSRFEECRREFQKYLDMPTATWNIERAYAYRMIGSTLELENQDGSAWFYKSIAEDPKSREPWLELAFRAYKKNDWNSCYLNAKMALEIKEKTTWHTTDPKSWTWPAHDFAAIAAHHLGLKEESITQGQLAVDHLPTDERLIKNLEFYKE